MANLLTIPNLKDTFKVKVGLSDHSFGSTVPIVATSLGATVIEKHFVLDRSNGGVDAAFSMEPHEFSEMVKAVREAKKALGEIQYDLPERNKMRRRSLFIAEDIKQGELFSEDNIKSVRPGYGLHPKYYYKILGKRASKNLTKGTPLAFEHIQD
jgi:pseudaminic acid synthase